MPFRETIMITVSCSIWYYCAKHTFSGWGVLGTIMTHMTEDHITSIKHCAPRLRSKMATIDECIVFGMKNIGLWWRYGISRYCDEWKTIIIGRIFESEIILIPPSLPPVVLVEPRHSSQLRLILYLHQISSVLL
jgi:hypothetical protein